MPTFPLATLAATIDGNGISAPPFEDILASIQASFRLIYGDDIYIEPDSKDGQWLAFLAKAQDDTNQIAIAVYNQFSPWTAVGVGLSSVVRVNGLSRQVASFSTVVVTVVGQAGGEIISGLITDTVGLGTRWALPDVVVIPTSGQIDVTATSLTAGAVTAAPGTLTSIVTPNPKWQTVTNALAAAPGAPVEFDYQLRARQVVSTNLPAQTPFTALRAAVAQVAGVQLVGGHDNPTDLTDVDGLPPHSVALVVEGGNTTDVITAIALNKTPGANTVGTTSGTFTDTYGVPSTISYYPLAITQVYYRIVINIKPGYASRTGDLILASVADYLNNLRIGEDVAINKLYAPANLQGGSALRATGLIQDQLDTLSDTYEVQGIFVGLSAGSIAASDLALPFTAIADVADITVNGALTVVV